LWQKDKQSEVELWLLFLKNRDLIENMFLFDVPMIMYHSVVEKNAV